VGGIAAVARITSEQGAIAEIFPPIAAVSALPAGSAKPRHADALPDVKRIDAVPHHFDAADDFVTRHDRKFGIGQLAINDVQVGAAHPARRHANSDFADCRPRLGRLHKLKRRARPFQHHCLHVGKSIAPLGRGKAPPRVNAAVS
jgi:hypothetical protein